MYKQSPCGVHVVCLLLKLYIKYMSNTSQVGVCGMYGYVCVYIFVLLNWPIPSFIHTYHTHIHRRAVLIILF